MTNIKDKIYLKSPHIVQNIIISLFNIVAYNKRYGSKYKEFKKQYLKNRSLSYDDLKDIQTKKYRDFVKYVNEKSKYYNSIFKKIKNPENLDNIQQLPVIDKETLRKNIHDIYTIDKSTGVLSKTGGTTGKSLEVLYTSTDIQERFAILDNFRNGFGYQLGKKTAWFSGKNLLTKKDLQKNRFWKTDYIYKVRYYSTFHIHTTYLEHYLKNLISYKPQYMVGFPSTMYEIAKYGKNNNIEFPEHVIKAIFPTAETITDDIRHVLEGYFKTNLYNQYASSEGAPFIVECKNKKLHLELQSGVFEVLDNNNQPAQKGRLIVTSFNTHGTPLIRYDIGDEIELSDDTCSCGNHNPTVKQILGRMSDYIYSEETGKINLGNISNCLKGVHGIIKFQIQQHVPDEIIVLINKDENIFSLKEESTFLKNIIDRVGPLMNIKIEYVTDIPVEKSGKFLLVKNTLKI
ncbi:phenylacetate--CoA ligase family protein [Yeosuana marina]|uniref:phenylacetate--CoA ligase family protein n=1 Tax=Yeosuana marina TaxID=1565536 RepID=UPI001F0E272B|nr:phenylacetate--CoA ligase family protein [Yeosuana marina]